MTAKFKNGFHTAGDTSEHVINAGPCIVWGIRPELTTTGTIILRNTATAAAGTPVVTCAIGLSQAGKSLDGMLFDTGLTVQLSVGTDISTITWEPVV